MRRRSFLCGALVSGASLAGFAGMALHAGPAGATTRSIGSKVFPTTFDLPDGFDVVFECTGVETCIQMSVFVRYHFHH